MGGEGAHVAAASESGRAKDETVQDQHRACKWGGVAMLPGTGRGGESSPDLPARVGRGRKGPQDLQFAAIWRGRVGPMLQRRLSVAALRVVTGGGRGVAA